MDNPFGTLRFRFMLLSLIVFGCIHVGRSLWLYWAATSFFLERFDARLIAESEVIRDALRSIDEREMEIGAFDGLLLRLLRPIDGAVVLRDVEGRIVFRTDGLPDDDVPFDSAARGTRETGKPVLQSIDAAAARVFESGDRLRVITRYHDAARLDRDCYIQVCMSLRRTEEGLESIRAELTYVTCVALLVIALASYLLVRRALAPIGQIAREARELTAERLDRRLPMPPGRDEVAEMTETLNGMLARLEAAFQSQQRFISNAAHELRTPVTHLLGRAQVLLREPPDIGQFIEFSRSVQDEMRVLSRVIESLLVLARVDAGLPLSSRSIVSHNDIVMDAVDRSAAYAQQRLVRLAPTLHAPTDGSELLIEGDGDLLVAMVSNLIRNAIRHSPTGETVEIAVRGGADRVAISVADRGPGIPEDKLKLIFERFVQLPEQRAENKGTGLGLAIARSVAEIHGGSIAVTNRTGGGSEFVITLPRARAD